jgi:uncharacterized lipoprotein YbaY
MHSLSVRVLVRALVLGICLAAPLLAQEPAAPAATAPDARQAGWKEFDYTCEGGAKLTAYLRDESVKVLFNNHLYLMRQVIAASGTRYSDGQVVWWSKGEGGFLQHDSPSGNGEMIVKDCQLNRPLSAGESRDRITGNVSYRVRSALPPDAIIQVQLQDVSRADAPAILIAEDKIPLGQRQVPVPFELKFNPARIDLRHAYAIRARILVEGQLRFVTDGTYRVLTQGNPWYVEINLKPVEASAPTYP